MSREICLPPSPGYTHVAMRALRRIVLALDGNLWGQQAFLEAVLGRPHLDIDKEIQEFLDFHGLAIGDIVDVGSSEFVIAHRYLIRPGHLVLMWSQGSTS